MRRIAGATVGATRQGGRRGAIVVAFALLLALATTPASAQDSKGADFWLTFPGNLGSGELSLFITGDIATSGTVSISGLSFTAPFTVTPGTVTTVGLPSSAELQSSDTIQDLGIHVTANADVTVYGLNRIAFTTDAYLGLPTDALGTDYINLGYQNVDVVNGTQFGIVATQDATAVTITPTVTTDGHTAGTPYSINLNQGQTYLLRNTDPAPADLSGTLIQSSKPIALFGGHQCANIPQGFVACDHIVEELPPTTEWGKNFVTMPLATRTGGDTFRVLASQDATTVKLNGATVATLNRGQLHEQIVSGPAQITADKPVLVMQYSNSSSFDGVTSDPFQMMIPPFEQFLAGYTVSTPASGFALNFVNVVAPNAAVGAITLDGSAIPAASFTAIGGSGFSGAQVPVDLGSHTLSGPLPFGVHSYGFSDFDSYGYPGGLSLSEVARVATVSLAPKTANNQINTQHCVTATVKDQNGNPLADIRVDFGVTGANPTTGFAFTNASGDAQFCYTGTNAGDDTITGTVGALSDTATKTWSSERKSTSTTYTGAASVQYSDPVTLSGQLLDTSVSPNVGITGRTLDFTLGTQTASAGPTDASGNASSSLIVTQMPGSVSTVQTNFAGDSTFLPSSDSDPFSIEKEDCTLSYTGDILVPALANTKLAADLGEPDTSLGDRSGKLITFTVTDSAGNVQTFTATTDASSHAETSVPLAADAYTVSASFAGDDFYNPCATPPPDVIVTVASAAAKVTGGGWISTQSRTNFGFNLIPQAGGLFKTQFQLRARNNKSNFHATVVNSVTQPTPNSVSWSGTGTWLSQTGCVYQIAVVDKGSSSSKNGDTIDISITCGSTVAYSTSGPQPLKGGNITIH
jgi:IgGFc binding protein/Bacterial Ig-like domain (group 1)